MLTNWFGTRFPLDFFQSVWTRRWSPLQPRAPDARRVSAEVYQAVEALMRPGSGVVLLSGLLLTVDGL